MKKIIDWLVLPDNKFGEDPIKGRNAFLLQSLEKAVEGMKKRLGVDMD